MDDPEIPVLVVGGGLAGLSTALFLSAYGVPVRLVERRGSALAHPRARTVNPRSVELFRQVGVADTILANRSFTDHDGSVLFRAETLIGPERFRAPLEPPESIGDASPCPWAPIDQDRLEEILVREATGRGAGIEFGTELVDLDQDADGVTVRLRPPGATALRRVGARYLVAADGNRSGIRRGLGIGTHGHGSIGHTLTVVFEADLREPLRGRRLGVGHLDRPVSGTVLLSHDGDRRWVFSVPYRPDDGETLADYDDDRCVAMIREAVGDPTLPVRIVPQLSDGTKVLGYELAARVADRFAEGRVFLVGDSAHVVPPTGAFGASTGIADAHNLAWKLAAVLRGDAGPGLLASYDDERRPVADLTMGQALLQLWQRTSQQTTQTSTFSALDYYATVFGYHYHSAAVSEPPTDLPEALTPRDLTGQPGTRAPHIPIMAGAEPASILDLFGSGFVLLLGPEVVADPVWTEPPAGLTVHRVGGDVIDLDGRWPDRYGVGRDGAVLVRPDGFVAWRTAPMTAAAAAGLSGVLDRLLDRPVPALGRRS